MSRAMDVYRRSAEAAEGRAAKARANAALYRQKVVDAAHRAAEALERAGREDDLAKWYRRKLDEEGKV